MLQGLIAYHNRFPKFLVHIINFIPVFLTAIYLILITAILLPLAVAICMVVVPLFYVLWRAKKNRFNPSFLKIMYPFELIGLTIVKAPQIVMMIGTRAKNIKRPTLNNTKLNTAIDAAKLKRSPAFVWTLRILAILGILGVAAYLILVAAVVVPLAMGAVLLMAPFCYLLWYVKEKKFVPLFHKIPAYLEQIGFNIVNSRKIMTKMLIGMKAFKWPMF